MEGRELRRPGKHGGQVPGVTPRRSFVQGGASGLLLLVAGGALPGCAEEPEGAVILSDPALCGACGRCALTCSALNAGDPGTGGALVGPDPEYQRLQFEQGSWMAATCRMCPQIEGPAGLESPACVAGCPAGAARIAPRGDHRYGDSRVRFIDPVRCVGCGSCAVACPYSHPLLERAGPSGRRARKCDLCLARHDYPPCVEECPASALRYYRSWRERVERPFPWENARGDWQGEADG
ncbi:MAG: 4Fe-4S dicluster domain-containing protein [Deltaproteobacteria bacterium]|nr:4Fe-4S dicluster domain-containing protein [Deltaproteobacteria bacterium]